MSEESGTFAIDKLFTISSRPATVEDKFWLGVIDDETNAYRRKIYAEITTDKEEEK